MMDQQIYKQGNAISISNLRIVTIFPGDLCGCRMFYFYVGFA